MRFETDNEQVNIRWFMKCDANWPADFLRRFHKTLRSHSDSYNDLDSYLISLKNGWESFHLLNFYHFWYFGWFYISGKRLYRLEMQVWRVAWADRGSPVLPSTNFAKIGKLFFSGRSTLCAQHFAQINQYSYKYNFRHRNSHFILFFHFCSL